MKAMLIALTVSLGLFLLSTAHAQDSSYCFASSVDEGENTCGHTIELHVRHSSNGQYGSTHLSPGESMNLLESNGSLKQVLFACHALTDGGRGTRYSGGRPVACK